MSRPLRGGLSHLSSRTLMEGATIAAARAEHVGFVSLIVYFGAVPAETTRGQVHSVLLWEGVGMEGGALPGFESTRALLVRRVRTGVGRPGKDRGTGELPVASCEVE